MKFEHIIWDWNGTLYNDVDLCLELTNSLLSRQLAEPLSRQRYRDILRHPMIDFYRDLIGHCEEEVFSEFSRVFHDHYKNRRLECGVHKDTVETLQKIRKHNVPQSILSAHPQPLLDEIVTHLQLETFFHRICGATDHMAGSKVDAGKNLIREIGSSPERTVLIGDTDHDAEVASAIGINCILIANGFQNRTRLERCGFPVLDSMEELPDTILSDI